MASNITSILIGSTLLGFIHVLIPIHWFPIVTISKTEKWTTPKTILATFIISSFHILSTILIGLCIGFLGYHLSLFLKSFTIIIATSILILIGLYYLFSEVIHKLYHYNLFNHGHHHHKENEIIHSYSTSTEKKYYTLVTSLAISGFLTPCLELESYYFSAGLYGWKAILLVSAIYITIAIPFTILLVYLGLITGNKFKFGFIEKYEREIVGIIMILIGLSIYFLE